MLQDHFSPTNAAHRNMDPGPDRHGQQFWMQARSPRRLTAGPKTKKEKKKNREKIEGASLLAISRESEQ
jgi:hypothetical protein